MPLQAVGHRVCPQAHHHVVAIEAVERFDYILNGEVRSGHYRSPILLVVAVNGARLPAGDLRCRHWVVVVDSSEGGAPPGGGAPGGPGNGGHVWSPSAAAGLVSQDVRPARRGILLIW